MVNRIGGDLNEKIDSIHDEDHGVRVCNQRAGPESHGVCTITGSKCRALNGRPVGKCRSEWFNPFSTWYGHVDIKLTNLYHRICNLGYDSPCSDNLV